MDELGGENVKATQVRALRARTCTVCRRTINAGDTYKRFTIFDPVTGLSRLQKACLHHEEDDPETDTRTTAMRRIDVAELEKKYPPIDPENPPENWQPDSDKPQEMASDLGRFEWGNRDTDVCRIAGKRKDGLFTLRVDQDMLQRIADEFGVDDPDGWLK